MSGENSALTWLPVLGGLALKSLFVFLVAGVALFTLRRASASARHLVCLLTLAGLLALPPLSLGLPGWRLAVLANGKEPTPRQVAAPPGTGEGGVLDAGKAGAASSAPTALAPTDSVLNSSSSRFGRTPVSEANKEVGSSWPLLLVSLWLLGALLAGLRPLLGLRGIARLSQTSDAVVDASTLALTAGCVSALGLTQTPALRQADAPVPMTWGWRRPVVLLPANAGDWPEERLRAVLLHELAHVRRRDWLSHRFADLVCALYWFHPLAWLTVRRLRTEGEIACDDLVLTAGVAAPDYARHLLDVARTLRPVSSSVPQAAIAMARTARIEGRLKMILDTTRPRRALTRRALLLVLSLSAAALVPLAVLHLSERAQAAPGVVPARHLTILHVTAATPALAAAGGVPVQLMRVTTDSGAPHGPGQRRIRLAFRLPAAAQDVTVKYALTNSLNSSSDGTWPLKMQGTSRQTEAQLNARTGGARIVTATFPASVSRTDVRVSTASGPWKVIETARRNASGRIESFSVQRENTSYIFSPLTETKRGTTLTVSVNAAEGSSTEDLRLVAVDGQSREVLPTEIGDDSLGALDQITAHFALPPAQIKDIRLESRPFRYVEFKNVALRPAK